MHADPSKILTVFFIAISDRARVNMQIELKSLS